MTEWTEPNTPLEAYKAIIDQLVNETRESISARLVEEEGIFSRAPADQHFNQVIQSLDEHQRSRFSQMLADERQGAIHDVLATLTWWIVARNVKWTFRDQPMPVDLSGMGLHGDYIGRLNDWEWPAE